MNENAEFVIGVDGGGTKTLAWIAPLVETPGRPYLGRGTAGPGNPRAAGFEAAQANIAMAIEAAFADAKLPPRAAAAACFGLAGAGREDEQTRIAEWGRKRGIARIVRVSGDAEIILGAASPENCGVALISGTGSMAWGRNAAGITARCGGWGYLLGDEGSGYSIALQGLRSAVRAADGRGPLTELLPRFQESLQADEPTDLVGKVYGADMNREGIAALAGVVFDAARQDPVAAQIIEQAADDLAEMVAVLVSRLRLPADRYALALAGGVILNQPLLRDYLDQHLRWLALAPGTTQLVPDPVAGAVALARKL